MRDSSNEGFGYRAISPAAALSLACGFVSFGAVLIPQALVISIAGILLAGFAFRQFGRRELAGRRLAGAGLLLSVATLVSGVGLHTYRHVIEAPLDYERLSFQRDLASKSVDVSDGEVVVDPDVRALVGRRFSLRGYPLWVSDEEQSQTFLLSMDGGERFWGAPIQTSETVNVRLLPGESWKFEPGYWAVSGEFEIIEPGDARSIDGNVIYQLSDAIVRPATSPFGEWVPNNGGC